MSAFAVAQQFAGQTALVTGAGSGIGRATALAFAESGAQVVGADLDERAARETAQLAEEFAGGIVPLRCDVTDAADVARFVGFAEEEFGGFEFAFNNAGISPPASPVHDTDMREVRRALEINLIGVWHCLLAQLGPMRSRGSGVIVNTASATAQHGVPGLGAYSSTKAAVVQLSRTAARENADAGIRIHPLCPGPVETQLLADMHESQLGHVAEGVPVGRIGRPEEIAAAVLWLCSPQAAFMTGMPMFMDGGENA